MRFGIPLILLVGLLGGLFGDVPSGAGRRERVYVPSSIDGTKQPCYLILPEGFRPDGPPVPLLVSLHTWSGDVEQRDLKMGSSAEFVGKEQLILGFMQEERSSSGL